MRSELYAPTEKKGEISGSQWGFTFSVTEEETASQAHKRAYSLKATVENSRVLQLKMA